MQTRRKRGVLETHGQACRPEIFCEEQLKAKEIDDQRWRKQSEEIGKGLIKLGGREVATSTTTDVSGATFSNKSREAEGRAAPDDENSDSKKKRYQSPSKK